MDLVTLADVRTLIRHLPKDTRAKSTWMHVEAELRKAAADGDTTQVSMLGKPCTPAAPHCISVGRRSRRAKCSRAVLLSWRSSAAETGIDYETRSSHTLQRQMAPTNRSSSWEVSGNGQPIGVVMPSSRARAALLISSVGTGRRWKPRRRTGAATECPEDRSKRQTTDMPFVRQ